MTTAKKKARRISGDRAFRRLRFRFQLFHTGLITQASGSGHPRVVLRFITADQLLAAAECSVRASLAEAASIIRVMVPGYFFEAAEFFEAPDAKRQPELMDAVNSAKEPELHAALSAGDLYEDEVAEAYSRFGLWKFPLPQFPGASGNPVLTMAADEFVPALRARLRIPCPSFLPRFRRERGPAQQCNHQYSTGSTKRYSLMV